MTKELAKEILVDLFEERTIDSGELGRKIIFETEFEDMIDEIVSLFIKDIEKK